MNLVLDVGNTRVKWRFAAQEGSVVHLNSGWGAVLAEEWRGLPTPAAVVVGSVAGEVVNQVLRAVLERLWPSVALQWLRSRASVRGVRIQYAEPERFGIDRLAALVAARHEFDGIPLMLVDAGTAMTVEVLDTTGLHRGGMIMPGRRLLHASLTGGAANLAMKDFAPDCGCEGFGSDTRQAMHVGVSCLLQGGVCRALDEATRMLGVQPDVVLTGGDVDLLASDDLAGRAWSLHVRAALVLDGLELMVSQEVN